MLKVKARGLHGRAQQPARSRRSGRQLYLGKFSIDFLMIPMYPAQARALSSPAMIKGEQEQVFLSGRVGQQHVLHHACEALQFLHFPCFRQHLFDMIELRAESPVLLNKSVDYAAHTKELILVPTG